MTYTVHNIFYTLQGEGRHSGKAAVFCRFAGCNLWSGREQDRHKAICKFCDTDFIGGWKYQSPLELAAIIKSKWTGQGGHRFVVFTGGEPLLQLDDSLIDAVHDQCFTIAVETNGTLEVPRGVDWITVSPKAGAKLVQTTGDELKLVYPQPGIDPKDLEDLDFQYFYLQPMDGLYIAENVKQTVDYCFMNPKWRLSLQTHKLIGLE